MKVLEITFIGGSMDGLSFAYTDNDPPLTSVTFEQGSLYQLKAWRFPVGSTKFAYVSDTLNLEVLANA